MIKSIKNIFANFRRYMFLMSELIKRDFKVKYKRSVLGVLWSLLYPVLMMAVMAIVFSQMFKFKTEGTNYVVYLMTGLIMFNYFSEASNEAMVSVVGNFNLINKVYIPKYIFPFCKCIFVGINFLLTLIPWFAIILLTQFGLGEYACDLNWYYFFIPYILLCFFLFTAGVGLILSCISVFLRDIIYIYGVIITIWNYLTPIFYSIDIIPTKLQGIFKLNPLYQFITSLRTIVLEEHMPSLAMIGTITGWAVVIFTLGVIIFKKNQDKYIYYI